ncbi:hypothetical protein AMS69_05690 [Haloarcula rubripromontorii]|uniref:Uncharacterized protein n=1 Tax=Haloarcula rubripromontorii TaxID=1705562 RepID=A0A0M9AJN0_9EURY|nr:hypothetical protein [Haloarcula rubripromontorii]KOX93417.1 hypothetical protein AMS69_05690 [Haloarcula rubripromontorii]
MIGQGTKQLDLYDFFSIFIPGATVILAIVPLLPNSVSFPAAAAVAVLIIGGVVLGRSVHAARLFLEKRGGATTHRDEFIQELFNPTELTDDLVGQFYRECISHFDETDLPNKLANLEKGEHSEDIDMLYSLVRSKVHIDSRGRSRTFQAIYDFYGSMWVVSSFLATIYYGYAILVSGTSDSVEVMDSTTILGNYGIDPVLIGLGSVLIFGSGYKIFRTMRAKYRSIFVQYLMSDFIVISKEEDVQFKLIQE